MNYSLLTTLLLATVPLQARDLTQKMIFAGGAATATYMAHVVGNRSNGNSAIGFLSDTCFTLGGLATITGALLLADDLNKDSKESGAKKALALTLLSIITVESASWAHRQIKGDTIPQKK